MGAGRSARSLATFALAGVPARRRRRPRTSVTVARPRTGGGVVAAGPRPPAPSRRLPTGYPTCVNSPSLDVLASWRPARRRWPTPGDMPGRQHHAARLRTVPAAAISSRGSTRTSTTTPPACWRSRSRPGRSTRASTSTSCTPSQRPYFGENKAGADHIKLRTGDRGTTVWAPAPRGHRRPRGRTKRHGPTLRSVGYRSTTRSNYVFAGARRLLVSRAYADPDENRNARDGSPSTPTAYPRSTGLAGAKVCTIGSRHDIGRRNSGPLEKSGGFSVVLAENWSDCLVLHPAGWSCGPCRPTTRSCAALAAQDPEPHGRREGVLLRTPRPRLPEVGPGLGGRLPVHRLRQRRVIAYLESPASRTGYCPETVTRGRRVLLGDPVPHLARDAAGQRPACAGVTCP